MNQGMARVGCRVRTLVERMPLACKCMLAQPQRTQAAHLRLQAGKRSSTGIRRLALLCLQRRQLSTQRLRPALRLGSSSHQLLLQLASTALSLCSHHVAASGGCCQTIDTLLGLGCQPLLQGLQGVLDQGSRCIVGDGLQWTGKVKWQTSQLYGDRSRRARRGPAGTCVRRAGPPLPLNSHTAQHRTSPALTCAARSCAASTWRCSACSMSP